MKRVVAVVLALGILLAVVAPALADSGSLFPPRPPTRTPPPTPTRVMPTRTPGPPTITCVPPTITRVPPTIPPRPTRPPIPVPFAVVGQVTAVDAPAGALSLTVLRGNRVMKDKIGEVITVTVGERTILRRHGDPRGTFITLADVEVDDYAFVDGWIVQGEYLAWHVTIDVPYRAGDTSALAEPALAD